CYKKDSKTGMIIKTGVEECVLKFDTETLRDEWLRAVSDVCYSLKQKLEKEMADAAKAAETATTKTTVTKTDTPANKELAEMKWKLFPQSSELKKTEDSFLVSFGLGKSGQCMNLPPPASINARNPRRLYRHDVCCGYAMY